MDISATLTKDRHGQPLVTLDGQPFNGLDIYPADLRQMAQQLFALADMASTLPTGPKHWKPMKVTTGTKQKPEKTPFDHVFEGMAAHLKSQIK